MPRGRPRKPRLSRMDAAVDAMAPFGFPEDKVRKHVKALLKEYGGDEAWPFIEEYSYKELIDAILRGDAEGNDQEQVEEDGKRLKDKSVEDERPDAPADRAGPSSAVAEPTQPEFTSSSSGINNDQTREHLKRVDIKQNDKDPKTNEHPQRISLIPSASQPLSDIPSPQHRANNIPTRRRMPCYGWIDSDEEDIDDDFVFLKPMPLASAAIVGVRADGMRRKRSSRWDQRPHDP